MPHIPPRTMTLQYASIELAGVTYAIMPLPALLAACRKAGIHAAPQAGGEAAHPLDATAPDPLDAGNLPQRIADRRKAAGLTQAQLALRAGVRVETVNRIERGHVTPDFATIRKLVQAMADVAGNQQGSRKSKEKPHVA